MGTEISIYGIFFLFAMVAFMKHILTNASSLTRYLRVYVLVVAVVFISYSITSFIYLSQLKDNKNVLKIVGDMSYVTFTLLIIGSLVRFDNVKEKSRDEWKYTSIYFDNFATKNSPKPKKRLFDFLIGVMKLFFVFLTIGLFISSIAVEPSDLLNVVLSSIMIFVVLVFLVWNLVQIGELFKKNNRFNALKKKLVNGEIKNIPESTRREIGRKLLELYDELFILSFFYRKNNPTNDAIINEIAAKCDLHTSEYWHFLSQNRKV